MCLGRVASSGNWGVVDLWLALAVSGAYLLTRWISLNLFYPVQMLFVQEIDLLATLIFLPHGVKIVAAWLFGWRALAYLAPALALRVVEGGMIDVSTAEFVVMSAFLMASAPLAFSVMRSFGIDVIGDRALSMNWRVVLFVGMVSSGMNAVAIHVIGYQELPAQQHLPGMMRIVVGDMVGLFVVLAVLMLGARWARGFGRA